MENNFEQFVIWSEAPESMIHGALESGLELRREAEKEIPFSAKGEDGVTDIFVVKRIYRCSSCSLVNGDDLEFPFCSTLSAFEVWKARPSLVGFFFELGGFPWSFQQVSLVCHGLLQ